MPKTKKAPKTDAQIIAGVKPATMPHPINHFLANAGGWVFRYEVTGDDLVIIGRTYRGSPVSEVKTHKEEARRHYANALRQGFMTCAGDL